MSSFHASSFTVPRLGFGYCHFGCPWAYISGQIDVGGEIVNVSDEEAHCLNQALDCLRHGFLRHWGACGWDAPRSQGLL